MVKRIDHCWLTCRLAIVLVEDAGEQKAYAGIGETPPKSMAPEAVRAAIEADLDDIQANGSQISLETARYFLGRLRGDKDSPLRPYSFDPHFDPVLIPK